MKINSQATDILVVIVSTLVMVVLAITITPLRALAIPLLLIFPGYTLMMALFPRRALGFPESIVFTLCLSFIILILGGFVLNVLPSGLNTISWTLFSGGFTLAASVIVLLRRQPYDVSYFKLKLGSPGFTGRQGLFLGLAGVVIGGAIVLSIVGAMQQPRPGFTQLWLLPPTAKQPNTLVRLGMNNHEATTINYTLTVDMDGKVVKTWSSIHLKPNTQWNTTLTLGQAGLARSTEVEATLYRNDAPTKIYRQVVLWLNP